MAKHRHPWFLYSWLLLIIIVSLIIIFSLPRMKRAFHESGMLPLIREYKLLQNTDEEYPSRYASVAFPVPLGKNNLFSYNSYPVRILGKEPYHETIEQLLAGPSYEALSDGVITFIPQGTRLIGLTVSNKIAFVDFSKEFLLPTVWESSFALRTEQVKQTLYQENQIRNIVILVEGELLSRERPTFLEQN